jgi:hypothetical protein
VCSAPYPRTKCDISIETNTVSRCKIRVEGLEIMKAAHRFVVSMSSFFHYLGKGYLSNKNARVGNIVQQFFDIFDPFLS